MSSDYITAGIFAGSLLVNLVTSYLEFNKIYDVFNLVYFIFNNIKEKFDVLNYDYATHFDSFKYKSKSSNIKISNISLMQSGDKDGSASASGLGSGSTSGSGFVTGGELSPTAKDKKEFITSVYDTPYHIQQLLSFKNEFIPSNTKCIERLNKCTSIIDKVKSLEIVENMNVSDDNKKDQLQQELFSQFFVILKQHSSIINTSVSNRSIFLYQMKFFVLEENKNAMVEVSNTIENLMDGFLENVVKISERGGESAKMDKRLLKEFFDLNNSFRNGVRKELLKAESILQKDIKLHPSFKNDDFKNMVMKEYPAATKAFNDQEGYLKKRVSEILNAPSKK